MWPQAMVRHAHNVKSTLNAELVRGGWRNLLRNLRFSGRFRRSCKRPLIGGRRCTGSMISHRSEILASCSSC